MSAYGLGLSLGMRSIAAAVARGSVVDVVPAGGDATALTAPAVAYFAANGRFATGADARRRAIGNPDRVATDVLAAVSRHPRVLLGGANPADAVLAAMVQAVLATVAAAQGGDPARLTITHPTSWSADQASALADAVRPVVPAGVLQRLPNAVAAAADYEVDHPLDDGAAVGIVDVGATSYEAAVVGRRGTELVLLSPQVAHGALGGDQFDDAVLQLVDRVADGAVAALDELETLQAQIARARLRRDCRSAKEALSTEKTATVTAYLPSGPVTARLTRTAFEDAIRAQAEALVESAGRALGGVGVPAPLQAVVLTGGSTQIPLLQRLLRRSAGGPLEVVRFAAARGGALLAALAASSDTKAAAATP